MKFCALSRREGVLEVYNTQLKTNVIQITGGNIDRIITKEDSRVKEQTFVFVFYHKYLGILLPTMPDAGGTGGKEIFYFADVHKF